MCRTGYLKLVPSTAVISWRVIFDHQARAVFQLNMISTIESQVVVSQIVVVINLETQANLGYAIPIYVFKG